MTAKLKTVIISCLLVSIIGLSVLYINENIKKKEYKAMLDGMYNKSFFDVVGNLQNIETNLSKVLLARSQEQKKKYYTLISRQAEQAQTNLSQLPLNYSTVNKTMKYVNQLSDYTRYLSEGAVQGDGETENLTALKKVCKSLNAELKQVSSRIAEGHNCFTDERADSPAPGEDTILGSLARIEDTAVEYPKLIYDGPFSENSTRVKPKQDFRRITEKEAAEILEKLMGDSATKTDEFQTVNKSFVFSLAGGSVARVSELDGYIEWMGNGRTVDVPSRSLEECKEIALNFARRAYSDNMTVVWAQKVDNIALINLTGEENGVVLYPDMVKIQVAMDNGEIVGVEGSNFINNYHKRTLAVPAITADEAQKAISEELDIRNKQLAVIPTDRGEKLCYEFRGYFDGEFFIVYVDAVTGAEEDVFKVIDAAGAQMVV